MKENIKISILSVIVGAIQMILFLPDGYSCKEEINPVVVYGSIIPCSICIFVFYIKMYYFSEKNRKYHPLIRKQTTS